LKRQNIVFEFLGFGSPRAVVINFSAIILALAIIPTAFWDRSPDLCIWHRFILPLVFRHHCPTSGIFAGCHVPSCGLTHALSQLLHGDFASAFDYNKLVFIVFGLIVFLLVWNTIKLIKNNNGRFSRTCV